MKKENNIANLVKVARKKKGYSARKLAELCNISHTEISNIEKNTEHSIVNFKQIHSQILVYKPQF